MDDNERMPGEQSDQEGRNRPEPGTMPDEFVGDGPGNRFGETPLPDESGEDDEAHDEEE